MLLDCPLEYKKGESQTNVELSAEADFARLLKMEEEFVEKMCDEIAAVKPDLVFTEKGVSGEGRVFILRVGGVAVVWWPSVGLSVL